MRLPAVPCRWRADPHAWSVSERSETVGKQEKIDDKAGRHPSRSAADPGRITPVTKATVEHDDIQVRSRIHHQVGPSLPVQLV